MKILFFSYAYPNPTNHGLGTFNRTMIAGLANEHEVRVVSPVSFTEVWKAKAKGQLPRGLNDPKYQAVSNVQAEYCTWYYTPKVLRNQYGRFMHYSVRSTLKRAMREFKPDIVVSYWTHPDGEVAVATAHQFGVRAVTIVGGSDVLINGRHGARREPILNVLRNADGIVTVSEDIKQVLIADGIPNQKLYVSRRGIDRRLFHDGDNHLARRNLQLPVAQPMFVSVGRLVDVKGHVHLIEACRLLNKRGVDFKCYLLGDGPLRSSLERQIQQHGLESKIELKGAQSSAQLAEWYRAADFSVLASLSEGVPNVLLESIACGTPFVASNVGGIPEIADPLFDRLVPAANPGALADAIGERLADNRVLARKRRFEPPAMSESAETLSKILRSVQSGQPMTKTANVILHEMMNDSDVTEVQPETNALQHVSPNRFENAAVDDSGRSSAFTQLDRYSTLNWQSNSNLNPERIAQNGAQKSVGNSSTSIQGRVPFLPIDESKDDRLARIAASVICHPEGEVTSHQ